MANSGIGNKFVSVNLNKSYGQPTGLGSGHSSSGRPRPASHGGMVVLSRPRTQIAGQKGSKLAVPPPLNLPSLRREHAGSDPTVGHSVGGVGSGSGALGWIKPPLAPANASQDGEQNGSAVETAAGRSDALSADSMWGASVPSAPRPAVDPNGEARDASRPSLSSGGRPNVYMPPAARTAFANNGAVASAPVVQPVEKAVVLRGEDFPSLQATLPHAPAPQQKQKDLQQKQRQNQEDLKEQKLKLQQISQERQRGLQEEVSVHLKGSPEPQSGVPMRPQLKPRQPQNLFRETAQVQDRLEASLGHHPRKSAGYSAGPPVLLRLNHTSNWADDERDTGQSLPDRDRERDFSRNESHNNGSIGYGPPPFQKNGSFHSMALYREGRDGGFFMDGRYWKEIDSGRLSFKDSFRGESYGREILPIAEDRDGNFRRGMGVRREASFSGDMGSNRDGGFTRSGDFSRESGVGRESGREIRTERGSYGRTGGQSWETQNVRENFTGRDSFGRDGGGNWGLGFRDPYSRDGSYNREAQNGNFSRDGIGRKALDQNMAKGVYGDTFGRNRSIQNDGPQSGALNKAAFSAGSRGMPVNDPILDFGREKRSFSSFGKPYSEDPFMKDFANIPGFDLRDPFGAVIGPEVKVLKRKKDNSKQTDFYDPIRESFEAELERVQKMQEQERQRIVEEQERAQELARKQEEERRRLAREEEERQRRLEAEAREAAWRAEQEALEAARRLEDERKAREEEKRRIALEEERRKEAARQKLLELEERIAKRQAGNKKEEEVPKAELERRPVGGRLVKERDGLQRIDAGEWEDEERMVDRITSSASSESSSLSRSFETGSRSRDGNAFASDRIKHLNPWRREMTENGNGGSFMSQMIALGEDQSDNYQSANQGPLRGSGGLPRRDLFEGVRSGSGKILRKTGGLDLMHTKDNMPYLHEQRWNSADDSRQHSRISDVGTEFLENSTEKYGDIEWGQDKMDQWRARGSPYITPTMPYLQSSEADAFAFGRSRHSVRQPRVLPPPSMTALQKAIFKNGAEKPVSSPVLDEEPKSCHAEQDTERKVQLSLEQEHVMQNERLEAATLDQNGHMSEEQQEPKSTVQSELQSLPSVSSTPGTPVHVSHDDLEDVESPTFQKNDGELAAVSDQGHSLITAAPAEEFKSEVYVEYDVPDLISVRQEKHEEWVIEDDDEFAEEEDYDEEEQVYQEEDVYGEEEEDVEEDQEYEDVYGKEHALEAKNDQQDICTDERVKVEESVVADFEEAAATEENESELQGISDNSVHQGASFESELLQGSEDDERQVTLNHNGETVEMQKDIIEEGQGSEEVQKQMILQSVVQQVPMTSPAGLATMDPMQLGQSDGQNSKQSPNQQLEQPVPDTSVSVSQSNVSTPGSLVPSVLAPISAHPSQPEMPIKLQFGLFPGPPLLPATVPAIQIGSIQMPLHLHPQVGSSLTQMHPSQPPMFQFGQIRYPAPISQGLLPLTQQPMPYVQTTVPTHYSLGQPVLSLSTQQTQDLLLGEPSVKELPQNNQSMIQEESVSQVLVSAQINNHTANASQVRMNGLGDDPLLAQGNTEPVSTGKLSPGYWNVSSVPMGNEQVNCSLPASEMRMQFYHGTEANKNQKAAADRGSLEQNQSVGSPIPTSSSGRIFAGLQAVGMAGRGRGTRISHGSRSSGYGASMLPTEPMWAGDSSRFPKQSRRNIHRREFRVRENIDRTQLEASGTDNLLRQEEKSQCCLQQDLGSSSVNRAGKKDFGLSVDRLRPSEISPTSNSGTGLYHIQYESKVEKAAGGKTTRKSGVHGPIVNNARSTEGILGRHETPEMAVDAPLQSGIVRIFKQSGIETPSDEDDFIEVRSKRQMLNDRREQREKEIKAKSKDSKVKDHVTRKQRPPVKSVSQGDGVSAVSHRVTAPLGGERRSSAPSTVVISESAPFDGRNLPIAGASDSFVTSVSPQPLAPIGTPVLGADGSNDKRLTSTKPIQTSSVLVMPQGDADPATGLTFESQNLGHDNIPSTTVGAWGGTRTNHQVVSLTQIQLEEAMKPVCYETKRAPLLPLGDCGSMVLEPGIRVSSMLAQDKPLSSGAVPLNSLLAGETIQFGAVTSPTLFPPGSCTLTTAVSTAIGTAVASRSDGSVESSLSAPESDSTIFFNKGKHADDRLRQIVDSEAEAEAAASAVAVAAISTDESVGSGLDGIAISVAETKGFVNLDVSANSAGASSTRPLMIQSRGEDSITVALPADLSVETPSLSLWHPPLPNRQSSSGPVLPHFPGAPSHFPCFEMGPMLGSPIFAFGQHEEVTPLSQGPKCSTSIEQGLSGMGAAPVGGWQQCRSGVDSFYGAPASGFTGPFISPPGGIPGIQGPPHMLVYTNPFAPVGQFGQLGLSIMGTAYIPSGKQPDWKHTPASTSGVGLNEGDASSLGMMSAQRNPNVPTAVQHMAPGSSMMPIVPPPLGLFDMNPSSPFQSSADLSMQTQWSHVPGPPLHSMPTSGPLVGLSMPLQQADGLPIQFSHPSHTVESTGSRFHQVLSSKTVGSGSFSSVDAAAQFPDELGLGDSVSNNNNSVHLSQNLSSSRTNAYNSASSGNIKVQKAKASSRPARSSSGGSGSESSGMALGTSTATSGSQSLHGSRTVGSPFHSHGGVQQTSVGQYPHPIGYSEQRGTAQQQTGQKTVIANEWSGQSHRKIGGQGRSQVSGDKNFAASKMKQVYVVKPTSSSSTVGTADTAVSLLNY